MNDNENIPPQIQQIIEPQSNTQPLTKNINSNSENDNQFFITRAEKFGVPSKLFIEGYQYYLKDVLKNMKFSYKCKTKSCSVILTITKSELNKLKIGTGEIVFNLNKEHNCLRLLKKTSLVENIKTDNEVEEKGKSAIILVLDRPLNSHIKNLNDLGIKVSNKHIQDILYKEREKKYPNEDEFFENIEKITINLEIERILYNNLPFCYLVNKMINPEKGNKEERYEIYTSIFQLKHFIKSKEIYIDINYKVIPKNYLQILTILSYNEETKKSLPVFTIPMTYKSKYEYLSIFDSIFSILKENNLCFNNKNLVFNCDFANSLIKVIKKVFTNCKIKGSYFHFLKNIWKKAKRLGLCKRCIVESTKKIIFSFSLIPLIKKNEVNNFITDIIEYFNGLPENFRTLYDKYIYFIKNKWINQKYIELEKLCDTNYNGRNNILCEMYHTKLSFMIEYYYPKMASFVDKIKDITINYFANADENGIKENEIMEKCLFEEISEFLDSFYKINNKNNITFQNILELDSKFAIKMEKINIKCMKIFFGLINVEGIENEDDVTRNIYDYDEIEQILPPKEIEELPKLEISGFSFQQLHDQKNDDNLNQSIKNDNKMDISDP